MPKPLIQVLIEQVQDKNLVRLKEGVRALLDEKAEARLQLRQEQVAEDFYHPVPVLEEFALETLQDIVLSGNANTVVFNDGSGLEVEPELAKKIVDGFNVILEPSSRMALLRMMNLSSLSFMSIADTLSQLGEGVDVTALVEKILSEVMSGPHYMPKADRYVVRHKDHPLERRYARKHQAISKAKKWKEKYGGRVSVSDTAGSTSITPGNRHNYRDKIVHKEEAEMSEEEKKKSLIKRAIDTVRDGMPKRYVDPIDKHRASQGHTPMAGGVFHALRAIKYR